VGVIYHLLVCQSEFLCQRNTEPIAIGKISRRSPKTRASATSRSLRRNRLCADNGSRVHIPISVVEAGRSGFGLHMRVLVGGGTYMYIV
jgi:hypothetical protein